MPGINDADGENHGGGATNTDLQLFDLLLQLRDERLFTLQLGIDARDLRVLPEKTIRQTPVVKLPWESIASRITMDLTQNSYRLTPNTRYVSYRPHTATDVAVDYYYYFFLLLLLL